jgi:hypothetical protein
MKYSYSVLTFFLPGNSNYASKFRGFIGTKYRILDTLATFGKSRSHLTTLCILRRVATE